MTGPFADCLFRIAFALAGCYNDLIWWLPFGLFLVRGTKFGHWLTRAAPWICVTVHLLATFAALAFLRHGMLTQPNETLRAAYVTNHVTAWSLGWFLWMLSAMSFVGFCAWWGGCLGASRVATGGSPVASTNHRRAACATIAVLIAVVGTIFDFSGEGALILLLVECAACDRRFLVLPPNGRASFCRFYAFS